MREEPKPREDRSRGGARRTGRLGPFATRGRPKVADARTPGPETRTERAGPREGNEEARRVEVPRRNMVASPHAKTSRRRSPCVALTALDKAADIFDKTLTRAGERRNSARRRGFYRNRSIDRHREISSSAISSLRTCLKQKFRYILIERNNSALQLYHIVITIAIIVSKISIVSINKELR